MESRESKDVRLLSSKESEGIGFISSSATVLNQWKSLPHDRSIVSIPIHDLNKMSESQQHNLLALLRAKKSFSHASFVLRAQHPYIVYTPTALRVILTKPIVMRKRSDRTYDMYVVEGKIKETRFGQTFQVAGKLSKHQDKIQFKPASKPTFVTEYFFFDPEEFPAEQSHDIGKLLQLLDTKQQQKYFDAGYHHFEFSSNNERHHVYFENLNPILIREREHHPGENRFEFLLDELGSGGFGKIFQALTFAYGKHGELTCKRDDRIVKVEKTTIFQAYEEHVKAKSIFGRSSKTPIEVDTKGGWRTMRVEHRLQQMDMLDFLNDQAFDTDEALWFTRNLIVKMLEMHACGFRHKDIKPENLMLDASAKPHPQAHITDFGLSLWHHRKDTVSAGSLTYMSPEMLHGHGTTAQSDIFSLGICLGILWGGEHDSYKGMPADTIKPLMMKKSLNYKFKELFSCNHHLSDAHKHILEADIYKMLKADPKSRIPLQEALSTVEQIIVQRDMVKLTANEQIIVNRSYEASAKARLALNEFRMDTLDNLEPLKSPFENHCQRTLQQYLTEETNVQTFVDFVDVKLFEHCSTRTDVYAACDKVFDDYREIYIQLFKLQTRLQCLLDTTHNNEDAIADIRKYIGTCLDRKASMPLSLDYLAEFNRKCKRDLKAAKLRVSELENTIDQQLLKPKM